MLKNEEDIVESFIRYNLNILDEMIILDNFSTDNTLNILKSLKREGLPIHIIKDEDESFNQDIKSKEYLYKSNTIKKGNNIENKPVEFNCNCIGKYTYKSTEAITIINNNTNMNDNNPINTYYTSDLKTRSKTETTNNNRISMNKTQKMTINESKMLSIKKQQKKKIV